MYKRQGKEQRGGLKDCVCLKIIEAVEEKYEIYID